MGPCHTPLRKRFALFFRGGRKCYDASIVDRTFYFVCESTRKYVLPCMPVLYSRPRLKDTARFFFRVSLTRESVFKIPGPLTHRPRGQRRRSMCQKTEIRSRNTTTKRCCLKPTTQSDSKAATTAAVLQHVHTIV